MGRKPNPHVEIFEEAQEEDVISQIEDGACVKHTWEDASGNIKSPSIELKKDSMTLKYNFSGPNGVEEYKSTKERFSKMDEFLCD